MFSSSGTDLLPDGMMALVSSVQYIEPHRIILAPNRDLNQGPLSRQFRVVTIIQLQLLLHICWLVVAYSVNIRQLLLISNPVWSMTWWLIGHGDRRGRGECPRHWSDPNTTSQYSPISTRQGKTVSPSLVSPTNTAVLSCVFLAVYMAAVQIIIQHVPPHFTAFPVFTIPMNASTHPCFRSLATVCVINNSSIQHCFKYWDISFSTPAVARISSFYPRQISPRHFGQNILPK